MSEATEKVIIIGAGVAGLVAAIELENAGIPAVILESSAQAGGRVKTDNQEGYLLDHGFQVLLTSYPEANRYLDLDKLQLKEFAPGAMIYREGKSISFNDPLRDPTKLLSMAFSSVGTLGDKMKLFQLSSELKASSIEEIFRQPASSTLQFLMEYGFSEQIINNFFKPFFRGIFLEKDLNTSSRMFRFVFKMFSEGNAAVPKHGMQEIPKQLLHKLQKTEVRYNCRVASVMGRQVTLEEGEVMEGKAVIVATQPEHLIPALQGQFGGFHSVTNLYFSLPESFIQKPMLALVPEDKYLINNLCFMTDVSAAYAPGQDALLSVSVIEQTDLGENELIEQVKKELVELFGKEAERAIPLKVFEVERALPVIDDLSDQIEYTATKIQEGVYLAGDYLLNPSLNAAMASGRAAAEAVIMEGRRKV